MNTETEFTVPALLEAAQQQSGLSDFGDASFREPFAVLVDALQTEANLNEIGRVSQQQRLLNTLNNRLRLSEWVSRHPEIIDEEIIAPVVIVGLPRTGTTMLHRVLASDKRFFAPLWYEVRNPAPFMDWQPGAKDRRLALAEAEVKALLEANPEIAAIHPLDPLAADEDILLLEHSFYSTVPNAFCHLPSYAHWLFSHDNQPGYDYLKLQLQFLQWQKKQSSADTSAQKWLLKTPHHLHFLSTLFATFPDAKIIQTHRDPIDTIPSISSFNYNLWITQADNVNAHTVGQQWSNFFAHGMQHTMQTRRDYPNQFIDIGFQDLLKQPIAKTESIFHFIGLPVTAESTTAMHKHHQENQRDARPAHDYSLPQFGFSESKLKQQFADYRMEYARFIQ